MEALPNRPATGAPTISGTAQVGEALTADTSGIADDDGLNNVFYSYQWIRNDGSSDTDITDATGSTYPLAADDEGQTIKVKVTFTDDADNEETLTSDATAEVAAAAPTEPPGRPRNLTGTANADGTVTLSWDAPNDDSVTGYQILRRRPREGESTLLVHVNDTGSTAAEYTDNDMTPDVVHAYRVKAINAVGLSRWSNFVSVTPTQPAEPAQNSAATGTPTISGTAQVGETLTADTSGIADADGLTNVSYSYQWIPNDGNSDTDNQDAPGSTYTLVDADEGKTIKVEVSFTDDAGNGESLTSAATAEVAARPNTPATGTPTISGTAKVGETLTADTSGIADADGLTNVSYSYQWIPNDGSFDTDNQDAPGSTYTLADSDEGKTIKVEVSFTDDAGNGESLTSAATATVASSNPTAGICDRTEQVQDAILGMLNGVVDDCADVTDSHLAGITIGLRISNGPYDRQALSLQSGDFAGLVNIEQLAIYNHTMDALPEDVFDGLGSLESLDLSDNEIAALPEGVFDGLGSLESLDLSGNEIAALPEDVFDGLGSLEWLDLSDNEIAALSEDVFDGLGSLEWLDLSDNEIAALPEDVFDGLGSLESLDLGVNQIGTLPEDVFDGLGSLGYLELSGNRINALPEDVFDGLGNLKYLRLSFNQLSALPDDVFDDLGNLVHLNVQENQIGTLSEGAFNGLSSLERLDLSYNEIAALPEDVFDGLGNLKYLRLDSNDLASPPEDVFDGLDSLTRLILSHNRIHTLSEDVFKGLGNLTYLSLDGNPGTPFTLTAYLERQGDNAVLVKVAEGVPFDMAVTLSATGGTLSAASVTIKGGTADSKAVTVTRSGDGPVTVSVASAVFQAGNYFGIQTGLGEPLILGGDAVGGNHPATGAPAISGAVQVGETLTADTSGIADDDGLTNVSYSYQWVANDGGTDADISGETDSSYTLVDTDEDQTIKVRVSFTDDAGSEETLTSAATGAVAGAVAAAPSSYITVVVTEDSSDSDNIVTNFTVTWSDSDGCSTNYNIYLAVSPSDNDAEISRTHLGSAASGSTQATPAISFRGQPFHPTLELYCGAYDAGSSQNVVVASTELFRWNFIGLKEGTYSSAPLTALTISSGTLSPDFDRGIYSYAAELPSDVEVITLDPAVLTGYQTDFVKNPSGWIFSVCRLSAYCDYYYGDGRTTGIALSDADTNTYGFQVNLDRGENRLGISVNGGSSGPGPPKFYRLTVTVQNSPATVQNSPATGQPTISGTAQVGETLTVDTSGISDVDGLDSVSFSYQWLSGRDTEISGATNDSYALVSADEGKYIKVRVSFTDDAANAESLTSAATATVAAAPNSPATGAPVISGTAEVGKTLTADTSDIADADGLSGATFTYQWIANDGSADTDIQDATDSTYTLVADDEGKTVKVRVSFTDDAGTVETLTSTATNSVAARPNSAATGAPAISGTTQVGETLTADTSGIADADGLTKVSYSYQWVANDGTDDTDISGATSSTYPLVDADQGETVKVRVSFTDDARNEETLASSPSEPVEPAATESSDPDATRAGAIDLGDITTLARARYPTYDINGLDDVVDYFRFTLTEPKQVQIGIRQLDADANLTLEHEDGTVIQHKSKPGEEHVAMYPTLLEGAYYVRVEAAEEGVNEYRMAHGVNEPNPDRVAELREKATPSNGATGAPTIGGTAQVEETLTADTSGIADDDGLTNVSYSYQWVANDGGTDADISGETDATYTLVAADVGKTIKVRVSFTDDDGNDESLTSAATDEVGFAVQPQTSNNPATGAPTISGTAQVGQTLTADTSGIADDDGLTNVSYGYQWVANDGGTDADISSETDATYTLVAADVGKTIKVKVSFTDDAENEESLTSAATAAVAAAVPPAKPTGLSAAAVSHDAVTLAWDDPQDDSITGYVILRRDREIHPTGTFVTIAGDTDSAQTTYPDDTVEPDKQYVYRIKAINEHGEVSEESDWVRGFTPAAPQPDSPATGQPTISGTAQVGEELTADTSGIADTDGLTNAAYSYQWLSDDAQIGGATDSTYTLVDDDEGQTIKVRVTVTDDAENETTLTSAATEAVAAAPQPDSPATGQPTISGTAQVGEELTADTSGIADTDGLTNAAYSYQWLSDDAEIGGATGSTYTLVDDDEGQTIKVRVIVTDDAENETTLTSAATDAVAAAVQPDSPATGQPTITGTAQVGEMLTADTSGIADADGLTNVTYSYQWLGDDTDIAEATSSTYTLLADDEGKTIKVRVTVTDDLGNETTLTSAATEAVEAKRNTAATGRPTISGTVRVGETLTADTTGIADADGLTNVSYRYQWVVTDGGAYINISGETGATYTLVSADRGLRILVRVTFTDDAGKRERLTSAATDRVAAAP